MYENDKQHNIVNACLWYKCAVFFTFSGSVQSQPGEISEFTQASMYNVREIVAMGLSKTHKQ